MDLSDLFKKCEDNDYVTLPRTWKTYKWYKPILIFVIFLILLVVFIFCLVDILQLTIPGFTMNSFRAPESHSFIGIVNLLMVMLIIPALYIPLRFIYKIPLSSVASPIRGWKWSIFLKSALINFIVLATLTAIMTVDPE